MRCGTLSLVIPVGVAVGLALCTAGANADTKAASVTTPNDVNIVDGKLNQSLSGRAGDAAAGRKWFVGRKLGNCLACHVNSDTATQQFHGEVGPPMDGVADRYSEPELRAIIVNSKAVFGDHTLMPAFYRTRGLNRVGKKFVGKTILSAQQVEDVLAYLRTLKE
ncbi:MAG: sulfur oxidation c-type cytochrome SoxX [Hyphomicrobiaceae bacterium]